MASSDTSISLVLLRGGEEAIPSRKSDRRFSLCHRLHKKKLRKEVRYRLSQHRGFVTVLITLHHPPDSRYSNY